MQKSSLKWPDAPIYPHFLGTDDKLGTYRDETRQPRAKKNPSRTWVLQGGFTDTHADLMCYMFLCNCACEIYLVSSTTDYLSVIVSLRTTCPDSQLVKLDSKSWTATLIPNTKWFWQMSNENTKSSQGRAFYLMTFASKRAAKID